MRRSLPSRTSCTTSIEPQQAILAASGILTSAPDNYLKDREVKEFVEAHPDLFKIEKTNVGKMAAAMREQGTFETGQSLGQAAIADFFQHGLEKYVRDDQAALLLFEDSDIRSVKVIRIPRNVHILSTVAWLRGLQDLGIVASADDVIRAMTHPTVKDDDDGRYRDKHAPVTESTCCDPNPKQHQLAPGTDL